MLVTTVCMKAVQFPQELFWAEQMLQADRHLVTVGFLIPYCKIQEVAYITGNAGQQSNICFKEPQDFVTCQDDTLRLKSHHDVVQNYHVFLAYV